MTERKLRAILVADVAGFSKHMERDDAGTLARLRAMRVDVVDPAIAAQGGRLVKTTGDGLLAEFASADAALRCAVGIQRTMAVRGDTSPQEQRLVLRIGVNLGDVLIEGDDIYGDGVNVAARLESLAPLGGVCISGAVRDQVHGGVDVEFVDAGEQKVKNIARPIRCYTVDLSGAAAANPLAPPVTSPRTMSVGILPFSPSSDEASAQRRSTAITRDFTAMLARCGSIISVIPTSPGRAAAVRYLAEGEVREDAGNTVVTVRLIDAATGEQLWGEAASFADTDDATTRARRLHAVAWQLSRALLTFEVRRVSAHPEVAPTPFDGVVLAIALDRTEPDVAARMRRKEALLEDALRRDPNCVPALLALAIALDMRLARDIDMDRDACLRRMDELTTKAMRLNATQPVTWLLRSLVLMYAGQWQAALEASAKSIALEPFSSDLLGHRAWLVMLCGRPADTLAVLDAEVAMDPARNVANMRTVCEANLLLGRFPEAIDAGERSMGLGAIEDVDVHVCLAAAYANAGDTAKAASMRDAILQAQPGYTLGIDRSRRPSRHPAYLDLVEKHIYPGLRNAGFPEI